MNRTFFKPYLSAFTLLLAFTFCLHHTTEAQVVKTYTTGDLFKKKREKKEAALQAEKDACKDTSDLSISFANTLAQLESQIPKVAYNGSLSQNATSSLTSTVKKLDAVLPESENYVEEAKFLEGALHGCRDRGHTHMNEAGYKILAGTEADLDAAFASALENISAACKKTEELMSMDGQQESIFVDAAPKKVNKANVEKANAQVSQSKTTLPALQAALDKVPALSTKYSGQIKELEGRYESVSAKVGEVKDQFFVSPFHKANANSIVFSNSVMKPGSEAGAHKTTIVAGQPFAITVLADRAFKEMTSYSSGSLSFYIGDQFVSSVKVWAMSGDEVRKTGYNSVQVFYGSAAENIDNKKVQEENLVKFLKTFSKLTPKVHQMKVKYIPEYSNKTLIEGEVAFDCTNLSASDNAFGKAATAIEDELTERKENEYLKRFEFVNKLPNASLRAKVEKHLVEMGDGLVKRSRVFFEDDLWTVVTNEFGVHKYRRIAFEYILEDVEGNYYAGYSTIAQDPLTNGSFDTSDTKPTSDVLEEYGDKRLKTDYSHYRGGNAWGQRIVSKEKVAKYMK